MLFVEAEDRLYTVMMAPIGPSSKPSTSVTLPASSLRGAAEAILIAVAGRFPVRSLAMPITLE